jgi:hypothetical protein
MVIHEIIFLVPYDALSSNNNWNSFFKIIGYPVFDLPQGKSAHQVSGICPLLRYFYLECKAFEPQI